MPAKFGWGVIVGLVVLGAAVVVGQRRTAVALRAEIAAHQEGVRAARRLRSENERLGAVQSHAGPTLAEGEDEALRRARVETATLRQCLAQMAAQKAGPPVDRFGPGLELSAADWTNASAATPSAAFETVLWAAAGGDIDVFSNSLLLANPATRRAAQTLFDSLPADARERYRSPERMIAALTIPDVPTGSAAVVAWQSRESSGGPLQWAYARLLTSEGNQRLAMLCFIQRGVAWKLVVTEEAVAKLAAQLNGPAAAVDSK